MHAEDLLLLLLLRLHESQFGALMHEWIAACCAINTRDEQRSCSAAGANSESRPRFLQVDKLGFRVPQFEPSIRAGTVSGPLLTCAPDQLWEAAQHSQFRMMLKGLQVASSQVRQQCSQSTAFTAAADNGRQQLKRCVCDWIRRLLGRLLVSLRV